MTPAKPTKASRVQPRTLVPAARALYEAGFTPSQVLATIYGVDLPPEAELIRSVFIEGGQPLSVQWKTHPWELMIPLSEGGPSFVLGDLECEDEARAFRQAPNVVLIGRLCYWRSPRAFSYVGYDLDEVAAGRSTVVALPAVHRRVPEAGAQFAPIGASLLDVFHDEITEYRSRLRQRDNHESLEAQREAAIEQAGVEALRNSLAGARAGTGQTP